jgi:hypothetical protein
MRSGRLKVPSIILFITLGYLENEFKKNYAELRDRKKMNKKEQRFLTFCSPHPN